MLGKDKKKKRGPEDLAFDATQAHFFLFADKSMEDVMKRNLSQAVIEAELIATEMAIEERFKAQVAVKGYLC